MTFRGRIGRMVAAGALLLLMPITVVSGEDYYRWLDERGEPVHSDRPPPQGIDYEVISTGSGLKRVVSADEGAVPPETRPRVGNEFDPVDPRNQSRLKKNPELCDRAKNDLEALTSGAKVKVRNNQGEFRYLEQEEIQIEQARAREQISVYCE